MQTHYHHGPPATLPAIIPFTLLASDDGRCLHIFSRKIIEPSRVNVLVTRVLGGVAGVKFTPIEVGMPSAEIPGGREYIPALSGVIEFAQPRTREQLRDLACQLQNQFTAEPDLKLHLENL